MLGNLKILTKNMSRSIFVAISVLITLCVVQSLTFECGEVQIPIGLVANGIQSRKGQWPWLVSLHTRMQVGPDRFFCGASLINEWTLVTGESFSEFFHKI